MTPVWERQEPGWYTSAIGGISLEGAGRWYFWPTEGEKLGPYKSLAAAKTAANRRES
jgi:hypothetical protein